MADSISKLPHWQSNSQEINLSLLTVYSRKSGEYTPWITGLDPVYWPKPGSSLIEDANGQNSTLSIESSRSSRSCTGVWARNDVELVLQC